MSASPTPPQPAPDGRRSSVVRRLLPPLLTLALVIAATWKLTLGQRIIARGDLLLYFYPLRDYASQAIREGRLPLWNPYTFMGAPFLANSQVGFFYPLNIALAWLPVAQQVSDSIVLHLAIAAIGMYWLMRRLFPVGRFAAVMGAIAFGLGGYLGAQVEHLNQLQVLAWLPWEVGIVGRMTNIKHRTSNVNQQSLLALSLILAMQVFAGHTQSLYICLVTLAVVVGLAFVQALVPQIASRRNNPNPSAIQSNEVLRSAHDDKRQLLTTPSPHHLIILLLTAGALAILISAAQLLPTLELSRESYRSGGLPFGEAASFSWRPWIIARALLPTYGDPLFPEYVAYFGGAGLSLALLGALPRDGGQKAHTLRSSVLLPLTLTVIGFILALGVVTPIFNVLYKILPGFSYFRVQARWLVVFSLGMSMLVGLGTQALQDGLSVRQKRVWLLSWVGLMGLLAVGVWLGARISLDPEYHSLPARKVMWGWGIAAAVVTLVILALNVWDRLINPANTEASRSQRFYKSLISNAIVAVIPLALITELLIASQFQPYARAADAQALTELRPSTAHLFSAEQIVHRPSSTVNQSGRILALSSLIFDPGDHIEQSLIYTHTLSEDERYDRIIATKHKEILSPNLSLYYRLPGVDGYDGGLLPTRRFIEFASQFTPTPKSGALDGRLREFLKTVPDNRWLDEMAVRYIIADKTADIFIDGVYYDVLFSETVTQSHTITLTPYQSTALGLVLSTTQVVSNGLFGTVQIDFSDNSTQTFDLRSTANELSFGQRLSWPNRRTPLRITLNASHSFQLHAITNIDDTDHSFFSQMVRGQYDMRLVHSGDVKIYENLRSIARVNIGAITEDSPERVVIDIDGRLKTEDGPSSSVPRRLLLRDTCYPGWVARVDGIAVPIRCANILFREIDLPPTAREVVFTYEPISVKWGLFASVVGILIWLGLALVSVILNLKFKSHKP